MEKLNLLYEGKAKKVFKTTDKNLLIGEYKDQATAFNGQKKGIISGKGAINNRLSNHFMKILENEQVPTHFVEELSETNTLVKNVKIIPLEVIIRNVAAGSFTKRYGISEGTMLKKPCIEFSFKNDDLNDPLINSSHVVSLEIATESEIETIKAMAFKTNDILKSYLKTFNVKLIDFKLEFGKTANNEIILADEISPDTCRFWDYDTNEKLDKDRFRRNLENPKHGYDEMFSRILNLN